MRPGTTVRTVPAHAVTVGSHELDARRGGVDTTLWRAAPRHGGFARAWCASRPVTTARAGRGAAERRLAAHARASEES